MDNLCLETLFKRCLTSCQIDGKELSRQQHGTIQRALWSLADFPISQNLTNLIFFARFSTTWWMNFPGKNGKKNIRHCIHCIKLRTRGDLASGNIPENSWLIFCLTHGYTADGGRGFYRFQIQWAVMGQETCLGTRKNCWLMDGNSM